MPVKTGTHALTDIVQFLFSLGCKQPLRDNKHSTRSFFLGGVYNKATQVKKPYGLICG